MSEGWPDVAKPGRGGSWARMDVRWPLAWQMTCRNRDVYLKTWKTNFLPPLLEPVLYLLSFGYGVGVFIDEVSGIPYRQFVAAGIVGITIMQAAATETTYNSFVRMWFQKTWEAVTATPLSLDDVLVGEMTWAALKSGINATLMACVIALFGLTPWWTIPVLGVLGVFAGMTFSGMGLMFSAKVKAIDAFSYAFYLVITPMMLFSGTFFPLDQLPAGAQAVAQALPLTHTVILARGIMLGTVPVDWAWSLAYLALTGLLFPFIAMGWMRKRLDA